jgi:hypothetical protein
MEKITETAGFMSTELITFASEKHTASLIRWDIMLFMGRHGLCNTRQV